jgi:hypothetical protein
MQAQALLPMPEYVQQVSLAAVLFVVVFALNVAPALWASDVGTSFLRKIKARRGLGANLRLWTVET